MILEVHHLLCIICHLIQARQPGTAKMTHDMLCAAQALEIIFAALWRGIYLQARIGDKVNIEGN